MKNIFIDEVEDKKRLRGMGLVRKIKLFSQSKKYYAMRELPIEDLSNYILEEIKTDISKFMGVKGQCISKYRHVA